MMTQTHLSGFGMIRGVLGCDQGHSEEQDDTDLEIQQLTGMYGNSTKKEEQQYQVAKKITEENFLCLHAGQSLRGWAVFLLHGIFL